MDHQVARNGKDREKTRTPDDGLVDFVVTTSAALPWMTGPALLSAWHACGLAALGFRVVYLIPWLDRGSQERLWGEQRFATFQEQVTWLQGEVLALGCPSLPACQPYRAVYLPFLRSIVPVQDVFKAAPASRCLVANEPEHLGWYPPLTAGRKAIRSAKTIGLSMTNYEAFVQASGLPFSERLSKVISWLNGWAINQRIDLPLRLSPALTLPNVAFRDARITGGLPAYAQVPPVSPETGGAYFLGALIWEKGLADLERIALGSGQPIAVYGNGRDEHAFRAQVAQRGAALAFHGPNARFWEEIKRYRVFVNPSRSEVLCTATVEALLAGRHVVLPDCPGNLPFQGYANAHFYSSLEGAVAALQAALTTEPDAPLAVRDDFNWMASCRRLAALSGVENSGEKAR